MDDLDRAILRCLLADGRATFHEIGRRVRLSPPAVKRRVDRMLARGEISHFTAVIDPGSLGWEVEAYVEIYYDGNVLKDELATSLAGIPQVVGVWNVSGDADALVHVMAGSIAELEDTIEQIRRTDRLQRTRSAIVLSRLFERSLG
ncbi:Lrp/AsnC family transcriptional regulator [Phycicoccus endophyticus]|uniref:Lrp/AsnC family transcriptional regulator n=1 Tax=Phycicoccus endophyticus TaxID=1690220 RepID=A0A7G9QZN9_9MICO|nr:Lrp/AsnC family transcriptional regulator [Phycicoccus endophyticus]NHI20006.1 Lrp/AsnC family transcriptional regulator [Phycicoccus endophyticus]QNN48814.1 Lrp/AsnC family transcriptional regulator [Phycicoccus endophyticus]GGL42689.1 AsnC family transcriptional regulator [Phycicoccus endophyticus]